MHTSAYHAETVTGKKHTQIQLPGRKWKNSAIKKMKKSAFEAFYLLKMHIELEFWVSNCILPIDIDYM